MRISPLSAILFTWALFHQVAFSEPILLEAENSLASDSSSVVDENASAKGYAANPHEWQPLALFKSPEQDSSTVWIRHRGTSICLKSISEDGTQKELKWIYEKPNTWTWTKVGVFSKQDLGKSMILIRGTEAKPDAGLDAVAIVPANTTPDGANPVKFKEAAPGAASEENAAIKASSAPEIAEDPVTANIEIDWSKSPFKTTRDIFSVAAFSAFDPTAAANPEYHKNIEYMHPGVLRYHNMAVLGDSKKDPSGWIDYDHKSWDAKKIEAALKAFSPKDTRRVICIPEWPNWMDKNHDGFLDNDQHKAFADFCADLVRIINVDLKQKVEYFEITNELDGRFWIDPRKNNQPVRTAELAEIYNQAAQAMKKVDPSIKLGGPAAMRSDLTNDMRQFVKKAGANLDFLSFHAYCSGTLGESDVSIYDKSELIGKFVHDLRAMLDEESPGRHIEAHLNEYNISWTWETREPRMINNKGAVFDSLVFLQAASNGLDVGNAWNERDNIYGKMSGDNQLRPAAHAFHYFNNWMVGDAATTNSDMPKKVVAGAVKEGKSYAMVLINRSNATNQAALKITGWNFPEGAKFDTACISGTGLATGMVSSDAFKNPISLPPHSVTFYRSAVP